MKHKSLNKAVVLLVLVAALGLNKASAQQTASNSTTLNVVINPIISIAVNDASVTLTLASETDYLNGVSESMPGHLTVTSLMPYTINVKSDNSDLAGTATPANTISAGVVSVTLPASTTNTGLGGTTSAVTGLTNANQPLITNGLPSLNRAIDVTYAIPDTKSNSTDILGKPADTYHSNVTYTISSL